MLASILNSDRAIEVNIQIVRTFVETRKIIGPNIEIAKKISIIEALSLQHYRDIKKHDEILGEI
jgi:hypothetical protein